MGLKDSAAESPQGVRLTHIHLSIRVGFWPQPKFRGRIKLN